VPYSVGLTTPRYNYGPANLVGRPGCVAFQGRCALVALPAYSGHPGFYVGNEGLPEGCAPNGSAKYLWVLGRFCFETFLRSACLEWLCQTLAAMQDIWVSLHSIRSRSTDFWVHHRLTPDIATTATISLTTPSHDTTFKNLLDIPGYWTSLIEASPRSARLQGLPEVGPARLLAAMLRRSGGLYTSFDQDHDSVFLLFFGASNQPCCLHQCSGTTLRVRLRRPLVFLVVPTYWETRFSSRRYSTYFFLFFLFGPSYRPSRPP
jgi:hypothetical protein